MIIKNVCIHDAVHQEPYVGDILIKDGKISQIGRVQTPEQDMVYDGAGLNAYPGFVDAHSHLGLDSYGGPTGGTYDDNETNDICSPQLRGIDSYNPQDRFIPLAVEGGVTTICATPGSACVLGGTALVVKLKGTSVEEGLMVPNAAMKCAFGENPKIFYGKKCNTARMTTAAHLREALFAARDYMLRKEAVGGDITKAPVFNMKHEALIPVLKGEIPLKAHAHRADDILTALRIAREFKAKITIEHCTEGHLIVNELKAANVPIAVGPTMIKASKPEVCNKSWSTPGILSAAGLQVSIISDAPVVPQEYLPIYAGMAIKAGMEPFDALKAITINAARHIGVADQVGSLEVGKDADIVLVEGDPMFTGSIIKAVFIDGEQVK